MLIRPTRKEVLEQVHGEFHRARVAAKAGRTDEVIIAIDSAVTICETHPQYAHDVLGDLAIITRATRELCTALQKSEGSLETVEHRIEYLREASLH